MKITFFAHSTTTDNASHIATGWLQGELSEKGIAQAKALPGLCPDLSFTTIYTSDLQRAIDSAELGFGKSHPIKTDWRLREANYGDFDGQDKSFKEDLTQFITTPYPNGESYKDVEKRIAAFLEELRKSSEAYVAIIGHEATQLALDVLLKQMSWEEAIKANWRPKQGWQPGWDYELAQA